MAEDNTPSLGGFDVFAEMLTGNVSSKEDGRKDVQDPPLVDPEMIKASLDKDNDDDKDINKSDKDTGDTTPDPDAGDTGDSGSSDTADSDSTDSSDVGDSTDVPDLGEFESDIAALLNDKFSEELGWDIPEEEAPKSVKEFIDFMKDVVSEASTPVYANEEVKKYDEFVRNGGNLRDFYSKAVEGTIDTESIDIDNSFDQKRVLREYYSTQGYKEDRISKMLDRYENAGVLEDEAKDALELLKDYNEKTQQKLLEEQEKNAQLAIEQQQKFVSSVEESIKNLDNVRGVKISEKDRNELMDYILKPDSQGITQYQKDYMSDIKNLLESAYFTKKGDTLINKSKAQGSSDAVKNLHDKLKANKGDRSRQSGNQDSGKASSGLSVLGSMLQGND